MRQTERCWTSTSTELSSRNPNLHQHRGILKNLSQPEIEIANVKQRSHWMTYHLRIQRQSHKNLLALNRNLEIHGSHWAKVVAETVLANSQSLHNWLSKMWNSMIWYPSTPQLPSPTIMRMASSIQSLTKQKPSLPSPTNGIEPWNPRWMQFVKMKSFEILWSSRREERLCLVIG